MDRLTKAQVQLREMDALAAGTSSVHRLHPLAKLVTTICYIAVVVSFPKYNLSALLVMALYPAILYPAAGIEVRTCLYKLRFILPLVCAVGLANPFFDHTPLLQVGGVTITGGMVSMVTLLGKGVLSLLTSFLLVATTPIDSLCAALRRLHLPRILPTLLLLTYRYVGVLLEETALMSRAYSLRAPGQKGLHISAWGSFLGQLLLRSMDRAQEIYASMVLRGFDGMFFYTDVEKVRLRDGVFILGWCTAFLLARWVDVAALIGSFFVR